MGTYSLVQKVSMIRKSRNIPYAQLKSQIDQNIKECDAVIEQNKKVISDILSEQLNDEKRISTAKKNIKEAEKAKKELISLGNKMLAVTKDRPKTGKVVTPSNSFFNKHAKWF